MADWVCEVCTLFNTNVASRCGACNGVNSTRPPDSVRRERLVGDDDFNTSRQRGEWTCSTCTLINNDLFNPLHCAACGPAVDSDRFGDSFEAPSVFQHIMIGAIIGGTIAYAARGSTLRGAVNGAVAGGIFSFSSTALEAVSATTTASDDPHNVSLANSVFHSFPTRSFEVTTRIDPCSICFEEFVQRDKVTTLPCIHFFHQSCIQRWFESSSSCPICKHIV